MKNLFCVFSVSFLKNQFANKLFAFLTLLLLLLPQYACNTTEPPSNQTLSLKLEDVSCTEAWLQLTSTNIQIPNNISLLINGIVKKTFTLNTQDSLLYIDSLLPSQNYSFQVSSIQNPVSSILSNELNVTTMDTTSHNFSWQTFEFGQHSSSVLYDVAIIDANNIWAVGEIYMNDSLGNPDPACYNAVHWDGQRWELIKIGGYGGWACHTIFAFSTNDIWFEGNIHWDGSKYTAYMNGWPLMPNGDGWQVNKMWGTSSNDLYAVGNSGNIAHYQNGSWTKIESGTDLQFTDIWGATVDKTGEQQILAVCTRNLPLNKAIYKIEGNAATQISSTPIQWELFSCWFVPNRHYYLVGSGIYEKKFLTDSLWKNEPLDITHYGTSGIRGNGINDVFVAGAFGEFLHFNGVSWKSYINETGWFSGSYGGIAVKNDLVITVGYEGSQAKILIGNRK